MITFERANVRSAYWIIFAYLIFALTALTIFFVNHQRNVLISLESEDLQNELVIAEEFIREDIASERYEHIEPFFDLWKKNNDKIVSISAEVNNGFVISQHEDIKDDDNILTLSRSIDKPVKINLEVKFDLTFIENSIRELTILVIISNIIFISILMLLLWGIMHHYLVKPLRESEDKFLNLATKDPLTKVNNRRAFNELVESEMARCKRHDRPLCMLMLDLDHFKKINDNFGHHVGDHILQLVSKEILMLIRSSDVLGRIGGEEFVVCLPELMLASAIHTAERIRKLIESLPVLECHQVKHPITVSIGVSQMRKEDSIEDIMERCDKALYKAKGSGRNCVISSDEC